MEFKICRLFEPEKYFMSCHSAHLCEMPDGMLWCTYFAGSAEKAPDVGSYLQIHRPEEEFDRWSKPELILKEENRSIGTAHINVISENEIWMIYNVINSLGPITGWSMCNIVKKVSSDGGKTWGRSEYIRRMWGWVARGKVIVMDNGNLILPVHREFLKYQGHVLISEDGGMRWRRYGRMKSPKGALEPTVVKLNDGSLLCYLRTKDRIIYATRSYDGGKTWEDARPVGLPNPDSMVELLALPDGIIVLCHNNSTKARTHLCIRFSEDNGETWSEPKYIAPRNRSAHYPCMIYGTDDKIHLVYTDSRRTINYCRFDKEWLLKGDSPY